MQQARRDIEEAIRRDVEDDVRQRIKNEGVQASEVVLLRKRYWWLVLVVVLILGAIVTATTVDNGKNQNKPQEILPTPPPTPAPTVGCAPSSSLPISGIQALYHAVDAYMADPLNYYTLEDKKIPIMEDLLKAGAKMADKSGYHLLDCQLLIHAVCPACQRSILPV